MTQRLRVAGVPVAMTAGFLLLSACVSQPAPAGRRLSSHPHAAKIEELTEAELRYGIAPTPNAAVMYQPEVVIVGGGAESIRDVSADGLTWTVDASAPNASRLKSIGGVSLAPEGVVLAHQAKVIVGIGAFGFATGPYIGMTSSFGISKGSDLGMVVCRGASLNVSLVAGVGYVVPQPVTRAINAVLRQLNMGEIAGEGGVHSDPLQLISSGGFSPPIKGCQPNG